MAPGAGDGGPNHVTKRGRALAALTDVWFIGYSRYFVTTVWIGDNDPEAGVGRSIVVPGFGTMFGGELPAIISAAYMGPAHGDRSPRPFDPPPALNREPLLLTSPVEVED